MITQPTINKSGELLLFFFYNPFVIKLEAKTFKPLPLILSINLQLKL
jgi:hypothetical protein